MNFMLGTSFFFKPNNGHEMCELWHKNIPKSAAKVVTIYEGGCEPPIIHPNVEVVRLAGDLGHIGAHMNGSKDYHLTGWSASVCALAMLAHTGGYDLIFKESDALAFGPWDEQIYKDGHEAGLVFGPKMNSAPWMACAQSIFLIKHYFIPAFVSVYLSLPPDREMLGEDKFCFVENRYPHLCKRMSFGVDRCRPIPWDSSVFYFQQPSKDEINEAKRRGLI